MQRCPENVALDLAFSRAFPRNPTNFHNMVNGGNLTPQFTGNPKCTRLGYISQVSLNPKPTAHRHPVTPYPETQVPIKYSKRKREKKEREREGVMTTCCISKAKNLLQGSK